MERTVISTFHPAFSILLALIMAFEASAVFCGRASEAFDLRIIPQHMFRERAFHPSQRQRLYGIRLYGAYVSCFDAFLFADQHTKTITSLKSQHIVCDTWMVYTRSIYETLL